MPDGPVSKTIRFDYAERDQNYWDTLDSLFRSRGYSARDILKHWPAYVMRRDLQRFLSHYELFKQVVDLPGCILDLGVFRGASFFTWSNLLETFCSTDKSRKVYGFDSFEGLQRFHEKDGALDPATGKIESGYKANLSDLECLNSIHNSDNLIVGVDRSHLVIGDIRETIPAFLKQTPGLSICVLHLDMDLYEPTRIALELLYPHVVKGGIVCLDEYGLVPWEGETRAVDEYLDRLPERPVIRKHPFTDRPHGYFVK